MHRFYVEDRVGSGIKADIKGDEARHIRNVLRLKIGDNVVLFDGSGQEFKCRVEAFGKDSVSLEIIEAREGDTESPIEIVLGQGVPKSDKMDLIIQKSTELGVSRIVPIFTERVISRTFNSGKLERWRRIAIEACKQSGRVRLPVVSEPVSIEEFVADTDKSSLKLIPWEAEEGTSLRDALPSHLKDGKVSFIVGPEGGLSQAEVDLTKAGGYIPVSLGKRILRTETVSLSIISIIQFRYGDLS